MSLFGGQGEWEYGVLFERVQDGPHRDGMTREEARDWIAEWIDMGGKASAVSLIRRWHEPWERA